MNRYQWAVLLLAACGIGCGVPPEEMPGVEAQTAGIARGTSVPDGVYPWAVSLHTASAPSNANVLCSGSHVAPGWVLTAQHCFDHNLNGTIEAFELSANEVWASLDRTRISDTSRGEVLQGAQVFLYNTNDLALLRLASPSSAPLVALSTTLPADFTDVTPAGWGFTDNFNTVPDNLQQGQFEVSGSNAVDLFYTNLNMEEMCGGDSGGPVFTSSSGVIQVVAAHTNSPGGCGIAAGAATGSRVDQAQSWIRGIIPAAFGFVWADQPATASYNPNSNYSYNSTGAVNTINRLGTGYYQVQMPGLGQSNGNVQVTSYGGTSNHCKVSSWGTSGTTLNAYVLCFTEAGAAADTLFVAQYYRAGAGNANQGAYLWANQPSSASYTPSRYYSHNSRGGTNTVSRSGTGVYQAQLPGFTIVGGNVAVTAYGGTSHHCKVSSWGVSTVNVLCFDMNGAPVDTYFTLRYTDDHVANAGQKGAYAWDNCTATTPCTPSATYSWSSAGGSLSHARAAAGQYTISIPSIGPSNKTSVMVTAYGGANTLCNVQGWYSDGIGGTKVDVRCRDGAGAFVDSMYTLSYVTNL